MSDILDLISMLADAGIYGYLSLLLYVFALIGLFNALIKGNTAKGFISLLFAVTGYFFMDYALHGDKEYNTKHKIEVSVLDSIPGDDDDLLSSFYDENGQLEDPNAERITIDSSYIELNVYKDEIKGTKIHLIMSGSNLLNKEGTICAYLESPKGCLKEDKNERYCTEDGFVSVSGTWSSPYEEPYWKDYCLFLPNSEIHPLVGDNSYYIRVQIKMDSLMLAEEYVGSFKMTGTEEFTLKGYALDLYEEHNGEPGTLIHLSFEGKNVLNKEGEVRVYLESPKYTELKDKNYKYRSSSGTVMVSEKWSSSFENAEWSDFTLFLPDSEIHPLVGEHSYYLRTQIICNSKILSETYIGSFSYKYIEEEEQAPKVEQNNHEDNKCPACKGDRYIACSFCSGTGTTYGLISIDYSGMPIYGYNTCMMCYGTRYKLCSHCGGAGIIHTYPINSSSQRQRPEGTIDCVTCLGSGFTVCSNCAGIGTIPLNPNLTCPSCRGMGRSYCPSCAGIGYKYPSVNIPITSGGSSSGSKGCAACSGTGRCPVCSGKGQRPSKTFQHYDGTLENIDGPCKTCNGSGSCRACGGDGKLDEGIDY